MEIVAPGCCGEITKCTIAHFERELGYLFHFRRNFHSLVNKTQQLTAWQNHVQQLLDVAKNNDELTRKPVEDWLVKANAVRSEAANLIEEAGPINSWTKGWCTCSRFALGRKVEKKIVAINELLADRSTFGDIVSYPKPLQSLALVTAGDFNFFHSREATTERVIKALTNDAVSLVGVYGMAGVGKTMLIEVLSKQVKEKKLFDEVVLVTISQYPDLRTIQDNLAMELSMELKQKENDALRARRLSERLMKDTKILIVLDDLWERLELPKVGVPLRKNNKGCKVIFTTRIQTVCGEMETDENIEVVVLSEQDSWTLFRQKAGGVVDSPDHQIVARNIANECKGLPLALVTIGRALRDKNPVVWEDTLIQLKKSVYEEDMSPVTFSIMLSFNFLENEIARICFLFCCSFPEDYVIDIKVLLNYVMGEKLLENVSSLLEARSRLHAIVEKLVSSSLLLRGDNNHKYKMHDVVRDVAISITSTEGYDFTVKAGMNFTEWSFVELEKCSKRLSLMGTKIRCNLPYYLIESSFLLSLSLNSFKDLEEIPPNFFRLMGNLLVLDLSKTRIKGLPSSFACLVNLRTLLLTDCRSFDNVSPIERLERLEILDLSGSQIEIFPEEMRRLTNLKLLDLSKIRTLKTIAPKVISSMSKLEELYVPFSFNGWEIEGMGVDASFSEVQSLAHLTCLQVRVAGFEYFSNHTPRHWENLTEYKIILGKLEERLIAIFLDYGLNRRCLSLQFPYVYVPRGFLHLLEKSDVLFLHGCNALQSFIQLDRNGVGENLKTLDVSICLEMKYLIDTTVAKNGVKKALSNLEELVFTGMDNLLAICNGTLPRGFLSKLRVIQMRHCKEIRSLIPCDLLPRLRNLEYITVEGCWEMNQLIQVEQQVSTTIASSSTSSSSAKSMSNYSSKISKLPSYPMFPNLKSLEILGCHKLTYLLPRSVVQDLVQLEKIWVTSCKNIVMINANDNDEDEDEDGDQDRDNNGILPRLKELHLSCLPKLSSFSPTGIVSNWPSLQSLAVYSCLSLQNFPWGITHQNLARMKFVDVDNLSSNLIDDPTIKELVRSRRQQNLKL